VKEERSWEVPKEGREGEKVRTSVGGRGEGSVKGGDWQGGKGGGRGGGGSPRFARTVEEVAGEQVFFRL